MSTRHLRQGVTKFLKTKLRRWNIASFPKEKSQDQDYKIPLRYFLGKTKQNISPIYILGPLYVL